MVKPESPPASTSAERLRSIYSTIGFKKGYNFVLWFILTGALMGFTLARLSYLDFYGVFCRTDADSNHAGTALAGECFYLLQSPYDVGMILHLASILPAAFLACFQFVPIIRYKIIMVHRVNGYIILLLVIPSVVGALMIARHTFGGGLDVQSSIGFLAMLFLGSSFMAYYNIKKLQIDQHRAWMIRAWVYAGSGITTRLILFSGAAIITKLGDHFMSLPCAKIAWLLGGENKTLDLYPSCSFYFDGLDETRNVAVLGSSSGNLAEKAAVLDMTFGTAHWLALLIHVIGVEIYFHLTPVEQERLRKVSYERQLEAGMKNPGCAGLTADRFGDTGRLPSGL